MSILAQDDLYLVYITSLRNINARLTLSLQILAEVIDESPIEVLIHIAKAVALSRQEEHVEALAGTDEVIDHTHGIGWMHVVINVAMHDEETSLEFRSKLLVVSHLIDKCGVSLCGDFLTYAVVLFAPPSVVDGVVVVACARHTNLEEIRILTHRSEGHEATT